MRIVSETSLKPPGRFVTMFLTLVWSGVLVAPHAGAGGALERIGRMHEMRASHTATVLPNGKVLIVGGFKKVQTFGQEYSNTAELYDPHTRSFAPAGTLKVARCGHTATLLESGEVLIVGGSNGQLLSSAELYDSRKGVFTLIGGMSVAREGHTATLLKNGKVLIVGGCNDGVHDAELYNTKRQRFETTGKMSTRRFAHTATLLLNGKVLVTGGSDDLRRNRKVLATAEVYDPEEGIFTLSGSMSFARYKHAAVLLRDGRVLIAGGSDERDWQGQLNSAESYDTNRGEFTRTQDMQAKRFKLPHGVTLLKDGTVLLSGGSKRVELFEPAAGTFADVARFDEPHFYQTAILLPDGTVLIAGGYNDQPQSTDQVWLYQP